MKMKRGLLKPAVRKLFEKKKDWTCEQLYSMYPDENEISLRGYRAEFMERKNNKQNIVITSNPPITKTKPSGAKTPTLPKYPDTNIKTLIKDWSIHQLYSDSKFSGQALQALSKPEFIEQGDIKDHIFWTSDSPTYKRPDWLYPWQPLGIDLMRKTHCMYLGSRQKVGKTLTAALADIEDCIQNPGFVITIVAPTQPLGRKLLRQMFKETIVIKKVTKRNELYEIESTGERLNLWTLFKHYILIDNADEKVFKNGSRIQLVTLNYQGVQGISSDVIHIEEFDKVVRLTKEGGSSNKLEALAALLPQIRARPDAKIRITCNMASGLFRILRKRIAKFGHYFPIYEEIANMRERFAGLHEISNDDVIVLSKPDVDDILKELMGALMGEGYVKAQLMNIEDHTGELWNPEKVERAYSKPIDIDRRYYNDSVMAADPGAGHAYAFNCWGREGAIGKNMMISHLWSENFFSADPWDEIRFSSKLEEMAYKVAEKYCWYNLQFFCTESNSGAKLITPYIEASVRKLLKEDPRFNFGKSRANWNVVWSNFGREVPEGIEAGKVTPKNVFISIMTLVFEHELIALQDETGADQKLHTEIVLYDPSLGAQKFKGDQCEAMMHGVYKLCGGRSFIGKLLGQVKKLSEMDLGL